MKLKGGDWPPSDGNRGFVYSTQFSSEVTVPHRNGWWDRWPTQEGADFTGHRAVQNEAWSQKTLASETFL